MPEPTHIKTVPKTPFTQDEQAALVKLSPHLSRPMSRAGPLKSVVPTALDLDTVRYGMKVDEGDVWIMTPPKCGTTWMQEIVWLLLNDVKVLCLI